jgi:hypothetical protein
MDGRRSLSQVAPGARFQGRLWRRGNYTFWRIHLFPLQAREHGFASINAGGAMRVSADESSH